MEQALDEAACVDLILVAAEEGSEAVKEAVEFGLESQELLFVHERSPRVVRWDSRMIALVPEATAS